MTLKRNEVDGEMAEDVAKHYLNELAEDTWFKWEYEMQASGSEHVTCMRSLLVKSKTGEFPQHH